MPAPPGRRQAVSTRNATFQYWQTLLGNRTKRNRAGEMIVQGVRPISLALESPLSVRAVLVTRSGTPSRWATDAAAAAERAGATSYLVAPELMRELGEKEEDAPELLLVVAIPPDDLARLEAPPDALYVALDRPSSPGNIGSIVRSVDALGGHGVIVAGHAADPYDPKALRASTGSTIMTPTVRVPGVAAIQEWVAAVRASGVALQIVGTDEAGTQNVWDVDLTRPTLIVTGNEHSGMSAGWRDACDVLARIPMAGHATSLNAANATAALLYEARRQRSAPPAPVSATPAPVAEPPASALLVSDLDDLAAHNPFQEGRVTPHRVYDGAGVRLRHLAFDRGAVLKEHVAPKPILVEVVTGRVRFAVGETVYDMPAGAIVHVAAHVPHEVVAEEPSRIIVTFLG